MSIIQEHKLIHIHSAKTAGSSIAKYFNSERGHHSITQYKLSLENFNDYRSFIVVRDPVDRFISAWNMALSDPGKIYIKKKYPEISFEPNKALELGLAQNLRTEPKVAWFWPQSELLKITYKPPAPVENQHYIFVPNYVLFFDSLLDDFEKFCYLESINFDKSKFPHIRPSHRKLKNRITKRDLTDASIKAIKDCYKDDYMLINEALSVNAVDESRKKYNPYVEFGVHGIDVAHSAGIIRMVPK